MKYLTAMWIKDEPRKFDRRVHSSTASRLLPLGRFPTTRPDYLALSWLATSSRAIPGGDTLSAPPRRKTRDPRVKTVPRLMRPRSEYSWHSILPCLKAQYRNLQLQQIITTIKIIHSSLLIRTMHNNIQLIYIHLFRFPLSLSRYIRKFKRIDWQ